MLRFNQWRANMRTIFAALQEGADESDVHVAAQKLERQLSRNPDILPGALEEIVQKRLPRVIYTAPSLGIHGLPIHVLRGESGWSLSDSAPVLRIMKTRQLADRFFPKKDRVCVLSGPDRESQTAANHIAAEIDTPVASPRTWSDLKEELRNVRIAVIIGHGWMDKTTPARSRIALSGGLRLTLRNIQDLGIDGVEVLLLSCWAGYSIRAGLPIGEITGGPSSWIVGGAGALLAPMWPIPFEAGSRFVMKYLKGRLRGETRAGAFHNAQKESTSYEFGLLCKAAYVMWGVNSDEDTKVSDS